MNEALGRQWGDPTIQIVTADKGYYDTDELALLQSHQIKTVVPERTQARRIDQMTALQRKAVQSARRSVEAKYGRRLSRRRSELVERSFQHTLDAEGARRTTLRGRENVLKRYLIQAACTNLSLLMRSLYGVGTPKQAFALAKAFAAFILALIKALRAPYRLVRPTSIPWSSRACIAPFYRGGPADIRLATAYTG